MDISTLMMTDIALNVVGYLAAGALAVLIYSAFKRDKAPAEQPQPEQAAVAPEVTRQGDRRKVEFIRFGEMAESDAPDVASILPDDTGIKSRRDRSDIIRVARTMLRAGAPADKIRRVLPISEAELSLLSLTNK